jgi:hypothetical protein
MKQLQAFAPITVCLVMPAQRIDLRVLPELPERDRSPKGHLP